ncbi:MAG: PQQ-binding-like beta-propeller repeat protein [Pirellulales bacterium]
MRRLVWLCGFAISALVTSSHLPLAVADWPQWRGPSGNSVSDEMRLPLAWSDRAGIAWKVELPGWGASTPAISHGAMFVTSQDGDKLLLLRVDSKTGGVVWKQEVGTGTTPRNVKGRGDQKFHDLHNLATPSPVADGKTVVCHFGNGLLAAYDFDGQQLWSRNLAEDYGKYTIWWGHANSPVLYKNLVISVCMQDSLADLAEHSGKPAASYIVAHDLATGRVRWHIDRNTGANAEQCDAYTTPVLYETEDGTRMIVMGGNELTAYNPANGKEVWRLPKLVGGRTVTGPTVGDGKVYATIGMRGAMLAVPLGGKGELARSTAAWEHRAGTSDSCCPVPWDGLLFSVTDDGIARCFDGNVGAIKWQKRLDGSYKASPVAADGRVYFLNTAGHCTVVPGTVRFEKLAENQIDDETVASPAISDGRIYIRGKKRLYAIER